MVKNGKGAIPSRVYTNQANITFSIANAGAMKSELKVLLSVNPFLESITDAGQEVVVTQSSMRIVTDNTPTTTWYGHRLWVIAAVADTAWTDPSESASLVIDDILDDANTGEFEHRILAKLDSQPYQGLAGRHKIEKVVDTTKFMKQAAKQLARSALFATNPTIAILGIMQGTDDGTNITCRIIHDLSYIMRPRPIRMLGGEH